MKERRGGGSACFSGEAPSCNCLSWSLSCCWCFSSSVSSSISPNLEARSFNSVGKTFLSVTFSGSSWINHFAFGSCNIGLRCSQTKTMQCWWKCNQNEILLPCFSYSLSQCSPKFETTVRSATASPTAAFFSCSTAESGQWGNPCTALWTHHDSMYLLQSVFHPGEHWRQSGPALSAPDPRTLHSFPLPSGTPDNYP